MSQAFEVNPALQSLLNDKVVALDWQADGSIVERDFLSGFRSSEGIIGRPAGVTQGPDGAIFITDDYAGVIYRVVAVAAP
jgi:glucose/arabinose dehydrogenase